MNLILFTKTRRRGPIVIRLTWPVHVLLLPSLVLLFSLGLMYSGYRLGAAYLDVQEQVADWRQALHGQRTDLEATKRSIDAQMELLAQRVAQVQAHMIRLDALGARLTAMAKLDKEEFNFDESPGQGGPESATEAVQSSVDDLRSALDELMRQLEDREQKLSVLESALLNHKLQKEVVPAGRPVSGGWMSSAYGRRIDPFTGQRAHHTGIDYAGKLGSEIKAVAAGVVTWAGERDGYGLMVEISHGNGYITRYAHNLKNLVKVGDFVEKGQKIALMGSSGRSTGPHVHFEVLREGKFLNPAQYIRAAR